MNANRLGWYMFPWQEEHNKTDNYDPKAIAVKCLGDTLAYDRDQIFEPGIAMIIEPAALIELMKFLGFSEIQLGPEGRVHLANSEQRPQPFFIDSFGGCTAVYEVLALKSKS